MNVRSLLRSFPPLALALTLAACTTGSSPSASPIATPSEGPSAASPAAFSTPSASPPASGGVCGPSPSSCASPSPSSAACPSPALSAHITADRLVDVQVATGTSADTVTFVLQPSAAPPTKPSVSVRTGDGPFVADPSGLPLPVPGDRFVVIHFEGMTIADAAGDPVYQGPPTISEPGPGLRGVVRQSAYEGVTNWIVGYDAGACASASGDASSVTVTIAHS